MNGTFNNNKQLFQTAATSSSSTRWCTTRGSFRSTARPHLPESVRQWMGDSRGRREGDTFVVETTNLSELVGPGRRERASAG